MGKGRSAPPPPDPKETAAAQTGTNVATAIANAQLGNVNQVTPYGSLTYDQTGSYEFTDPSSGSTYNVPTFTATQTTGPGGQEVVDNNIATQQAISRIGRNQADRIESALSSPIGIGGLPARAQLDDVARPSYERAGSGPSLANNLNAASQITTAAPSGGPISGSIAGSGPITRQPMAAGDITRSYGNEFTADRRRVEDALMERLNPQFTRDQEALDARLASQGILAGSQAYEQAQDRLGRQKNDARLSAVLSAGQEQSRLANLARDQAAFSNAAQAQGYGQNMGVADFANRAQAQRFGQNLTAAQLANQAQGQQFQQGLAGAQFANQAQAQGFNQLQGRNAAMQQEFGNQLQGAAFNNTLEDNRYSIDMGRYNAQNAARADVLNEETALRNQPINEISALLSGSQLQAPTYAATNMPRIPTTDYAGLVNNQYQGQLEAWRQRQDNRNQMFGMLGGLGKAYIGAM